MAIENTNLLRDSLVISIIKFAVMFFGLALNFYLAKIMAIADFAVWQIIFAISIIVSMTIGYPYGKIIQRRKNNNNFKDEELSIYTKGLISSAYKTFFWFLIGVNLVLNIFFQEFNAIFITILSILVFSKTIGASYLLSNSKVIQSQFVEAIVISLILAILLYTLAMEINLDIDLLLNIYLISYSIGLIFLIVVIGKKRAIKFFQISGFDSEKLISKDFLYLFIHGVMTFLFGYIGVFQLEILNMTIALANYILSYKIAAAWIILFNAFLISAQPILINYRNARTPEDIRSELVQKGRKILFLNILLMITCLIFVDIFLVKFLGNEYAYTSYNLIIFIIGQIIYMNASLNQTAIMMLGPLNELGKVNIMTIFLCVILGFILIPLIGYLGASVAFVISMIFNNFYLASLSKKHIGDSFNLFF